MKFQTAVLHAGKKELETYGATLPPVYQSSAFEQKSAENLAGIFENKAPGYCLLYEGGQSHGDSV